MTLNKKRKLDMSDNDASKRFKTASAGDGDAFQSSKKEEARPKIRKLVPPRPYPTVPPSVSATGPRSAHKEGKNIICITRKTPLAAYLRRCTALVNEGYNTLYFSAMGAAIPHLLQLVCALPPILPCDPSKIHQDVQTGTTEVHDELVPDDEDTDITYQKRCKSTLSIVFSIGDGEFKGDRTATRRYAGGKELPSKRAGKSGQRFVVRDQHDTMVFEEPEQEEMI